MQADKLDSKDLELGDKYDIPAGARADFETNLYNRPHNGEPRPINND